MKRFTCDIDGILNDYPLCWLRYLADKCGTLYETVSLAKAGEKEYRRFKDEYRNSSYKANLPVYRLNRDEIEKIIDKGYEAIMVTSRPILDSKYPLLYDNTYKWLINTKLRFSHFDFKDPDVKFLDKYSPISFHIDDDPKYAKRVADNGIRVYLLKNDNWEFGNISSVGNLVMVNSLNEIIKYEKSLF